jgi:prepilin peptidase CpaA
LSHKAPTLIAAHGEQLIVFIILGDAIVVWCMVIALYDLSLRRVPNWLLLVAVVGHLLFMARIGYGMEGLTWNRSLIGFGIGLVAMLPFYMFKLMGAGDVKFFAVLGLLLGPQALIGIWLVGSLLCGLHAVAVLGGRAVMSTQPALFTMMVKVEQSALFQRIASRRTGHGGIPYAAYLAVGAICSVILG